MNSRTVRRFWELYRELPADVREAARHAYQRFNADPSHPGLHFHRIGAYPGTWSVRITRSYRAVGLLRGDTITWFWIGNHEEFDRTFSR